MTTAPAPIVEAQFTAGEWTDITRNLFGLSVNYGSSISVDPQMERLVEGHGSIALAELQDYHSPMPVRVRAAGLSIWSGLMYEAEVYNRNGVDTYTADLRNPVGFGATVTIPTGERPLQEVVSMWFQQTRAVTLAPPGLNTGVAIDSPTVDAGGTYRSVDLLRHLMHCADGYVVSGSNGEIGLISPQAVKRLSATSLNPTTFVDNIDVREVEGQVRNSVEFRNPEGDLIGQGKLEGSIAEHGERMIDLPNWWRQEPTENYQTRMLTRRSQPPLTLAVTVPLVGTGLGLLWTAAGYTRAYGFNYGGDLFLVTGRRLMIRNTLAIMEIHGVRIQDTIGPTPTPAETTVWVLGESRLGVDAILGGALPKIWELGVSRLGVDTVLGDGTAPPPVYLVDEEIELPAAQFTGSGAASWSFASIAGPQIMNEQLTDGWNRYLRLISVNASTGQVRLEIDRQANDTWVSTGNDLSDEFELHGEIGIDGVTGGETLDIKMPTNDRDEPYVFIPTQDVDEVKRIAGVWAANANASLEATLHLRIFNWQHGGYTPITPHEASWTLEIPKSKFYHGDSATWEYGTTERPRVPASSGLLKSADSNRFFDFIRFYSDGRLELVFENNARRASRRAGNDLADTFETRGHIKIEATWGENHVVYEADISGDQDEPYEYPADTDRANFFTAVNAGLTGNVAARLTLSIKPE